MRMPPGPARLAVTLLTVVLLTGQSAGSVSAADVTAPVARPPTATVVLGGTVNDATPFSVAWPAAIESGSGIARYDLRRSIDGGSWEPIALPSATATSVTTTMLQPHEYHFRIRGIDHAGNVGAWAHGQGFRVRHLSESTGALTLSADWTRMTGDGYVGGAAVRSGTPGATATLRFTGSQVAWIALRAPTLGAAEVLLDGQAVAKVDLYRATTANRRIVFRHAWSSSGAHTMTIRVLGTAGRPSVDVDGFVLVDPPVPNPTVVAAGDISLCTSDADSRTAALLDRIAGKVFVLGDAAYEHGTTAEFRDCYGPTWGRWSLRTSPVPGDHEYDSPGAAPYFAYFGARAGPSGKGYYAYDLGTWRIYHLNSNCSIVSCARGSEQEAWLRADLARNPRRCIAAAFHNPRFSSGRHGNDTSVAPFWEALQAAGAEIVLNGNDHNYERFAPQTPSGTADPAGIRQFTVGTGGGPLRSFATIRPNSERRQASTHGVLAVTLAPGSYSWQFVPVDGGSFTDSGTGTCH